MAEQGVLRTIRGGRAGRPEGFELAYVDAAGEETRLPLAEAVTVRLEKTRPVRRFPSYRGQRNYPGLYYAATLDAHVEYESWLERDEAMALDYAPDVVSFAAQPFWLFWPDTDRARSHAPDFFARTADGHAWGGQSSSKSTAPASGVGWPRQVSASRRRRRGRSLR